MLVLSPVEKPTAPQAHPPDRAEPDRRIWPCSSGIQHPVAMGTHPATPWEPLELISEEAAGEELGL